MRWLRQAVALSIITVMAVVVGFTRRELLFVDIQNAVQQRRSSNDRASPGKWRARYEQKLDNEQRNRTLLSTELAPMESPPANRHALQPSTLRTKTRRKAPSTRKPGRDKDVSVLGLVADSNSGVSHAWAVDDPDTCHGSANFERCATPQATKYFSDRALFAIVTGAESAFRVEVSQCTWLAHFPSESVFVFSDKIPFDARRLRYTWVEGMLPRGVQEVDGDVFSEKISKGYLREVRRAGQGYSASWIVAQFRFLQALENFMIRLGILVPSKASSMFYYGNHSGSTALPPPLLPNREAIEWIIIGDDDTIVQIDALVARLRSLELDSRKRPLYLSQTGWGGAGHVFSRAALMKLRDTLPQCIERWMVRQFRASDAMMVKCAELAHLEKIKDPTLSHCPASNVREGGLLSPNQVTVHAKKDFYAPVLLATWRIGLYYYAMYCRSAEAAKWAVWFSGCAFGSCKHALCGKQHDVERHARWLALSKNGTLRKLPFAEFGASAEPATLV